MFQIIAVVLLFISILLLSVGYQEKKLLTENKLSQLESYISNIIIAGWIFFSVAMITVIKVLYDYYYYDSNYEDGTLKNQLPIDLNLLKEIHQEKIAKNVLSSPTVEQADQECNKLFKSAKDPELYNQYNMMKQQRPSTEVRNLCNNYAKSVLQQK